MTSPTKPRRLRSLNNPRRVAVQADDNGLPISVAFGRQPLQVEAVLEAWRIDDEWWRGKPISRTYYRVSLEDGRVLDIYRDLAAEGWFRQSYG